MFLREMTEELERQTLSPYAALSADSRGRQRPMEPCQIRTCYQRDIDRILHSKSFRRLMHKTQVFLQPEGDHYRTRMTWVTTWGTPPLATRGSGCSTRFFPVASGTTSSPFGWWTAWKKGARG